MRVADLSFLESWDKIKESEYYLGKFLEINTTGKTSKFRMAARNAIIMREMITDFDEGRYAVDIHTLCGMLKTFRRDDTITFTEKGIIVNGVNIYNIYIPISSPYVEFEAGERFDVYEIPEDISICNKFLSGSDGLDSLRVSNGFWFVSNREVTTVLPDPMGSSKAVNFPRIVARYIEDLSGQSIEVCHYGDFLGFSDGADLVVFKPAQSIVPDVHEEPNQKYIFHNIEALAELSSLKSVFKRSHLLTQKTIDSCRCRFTPHSLEVTTISSSKVVEHIPLKIEGYPERTFEVRPSLMVAAIGCFKDDLLVSTSEDGKTIGLRAGDTRIVLGTS